MARVPEASINKCSVDLTMCDLSKAFNVVPHNILLQKLRCYRIEGTAYGTLVSYHDGRSQVVSLGGASSSSWPILHGVLQGSGPIMFIIVMNDLNMNGNTLINADNSTLISVGTNPGIARNMAVGLPDS